MMARKQGFTLIELLAVIVILAIIALIATPIILGVVEKVKIGAVNSSGLGYIDAIENQVMFNQLDQSKTPIEDGVYDVPMAGITIKGKEPNSGWVVIENGQVTNYSFIINGYVITKGSKVEKSEIVVTKPVGGSVAGHLPAGLTKGTIVYMNPETASVCTGYTEVNSTTGTKIGCMKWYVYKDNGDSTYQLILDHNTTSTVAWVSGMDYVASGGTAENYDGYGNIDRGPITVINQLKSDTSGWNSNLKERLITANEVAEITENATSGEISSTYDKYFYFDTNTTTASSTCKSGNTTGCKYGWLYDRTNTSCSTYGCSNNADTAMTGYGYWTSTPFSERTDSACFVSSYGEMYYFGVYADYYSGVRPVITF